MNLLKQADEYFRIADSQAESRRSGHHIHLKFYSRPTQRCSIDPKYKTIEDLERYLRKQRETGSSSSEAEEGSEIDEGDLGAVETFQLLSGKLLEPKTTDRKLTEAEYLADQKREGTRTRDVTKNKLKEATRSFDEEEFFHLEPLESEEISIGFSAARSVNCYKDLVQDSNTQAQAILKEIDEAGWRRWESITNTKHEKKPRLLIEYARSLTSEDPDFTVFEQLFYLALEHLVLVFFPKEESGSENHFRLCGECKNLKKLDPDFAGAARNLINFDCYEPSRVFLDFVNLLLPPIHRGQKRIYYLDFDLDRQGTYQAEPPRKVKWSPGLLNPDYCHLYQHLQFNLSGIQIAWLKKTS